MRWLLLAMAQLTPMVAVADSPGNFITPSFAISNSSRYFGTVQNGDGLGRPHRLMVFEDCGASEVMRKLHETALVNRNTPLGNILSADGRFFVTTGSWPEPSGKNDNYAIVIYDLIRKEHTIYRERDFLSKRTLEALRDDGVFHAVRWRGAGWYWETRDSTTMFPSDLEDCKRKGLPIVAIDLPTRSVSVLPVETANTQAMMSVEEANGDWLMSEVGTSEFRNPKNYRVSENMILPLRLEFRARYGKPELPRRRYVLAPDKDEYLPAADEKNESESDK